MRGRGRGMEYEAGCVFDGAFTKQPGKVIEAVRVGI